MHGKNRLYRQKYNVQSCRAYTPLSRLREACIRYLQHVLRWSRPENRNRPSKRRTMGSGLLTRPIYGYGSSLTYQTDTASTSEVIQQTACSNKGSRTLSRGINKDETVSIVKN